MAAYTPSAVCHVLALPELLRIVFQFLDEASNATNALVSSHWSEIALDILWEDIPDFYRLFSILAPLENIEGSYTFVRPLVPRDWARFDRYRHRVRKVSYQHSNTIRMHHSVFDAIARSRLTLDMLPNMSTLEWDAPLGFCVLFMHKNVKSLTLRLPPDNAEVARASADVIERMPNIRYLDLRFQCSVLVLEAAIIELFSNLSNLQRINLPRFCLTSNIVETVSRIQTLQILGYEFFPEQGCGNAADVVTFKPMFSEASFSSLHDLSMTVSFANAFIFLSTPFAPANLTSLYLNSPVLEPPAVLLTLTSIIPQKCPLLKALYLVAFDTPTLASLPSSPQEGESVTIDTLRPLFNCIHLTCFEIEHRYPLCLDLTDMEEITTFWSNIEVLVLNPRPIYAAHTDLSLGALLPFARNCDKIWRLGLFLNANPVHIPTPDLSLTLPEFSNLRQLSMGASLIEKEIPVIRFLSLVCPLHCAIDDGGTCMWDTTLPRWKPDMYDIVQARLDTWKEVNRLLPLVTEVRNEERERMRLLFEKGFDGFQNIR